MRTKTPAPTIKVIDTNGQISLGKKFAGRQVLVEEQEAGVWLIRTTIAIPKKNVGCMRPKRPRTQP